MVNVKFFDGAAIVQMLRPGIAKTFQQHSDKVLMPYISSQLRSVEQVDIVWDVHIEDSLKRTTRQNRGKGVRKRVDPTTVISHNWKGFLHPEENKTELFSFLAQHVTSIAKVSTLLLEGMF